MEKAEKGVRILLYSQLIQIWSCASTLQAQSTTYNWTAVTNCASHGAWIFGGMSAIPGTKLI